MTPPRSLRDPPGPPTTLGSTARAHHRLIVWCKGCRHRVEFSPAGVADLADRHGADLTLFDWRDRLRCSSCGAREIDFVVAGATEGGIGR